MKTFQICQILLCSAALSLVVHACTYDQLAAIPDCDTSLELEIAKQIDASCGTANGSIELQLKSIVEGASFQLNDGTKQSVPVFNQLSASSYTVTATTPEGCTTSLEVNIKNADGLNMSLSKNEAGCSSNAGSIAVNVENAQGQVQYKIDGGAFQSQNQFAQLGSGVYKITARDESGCEVQQEISLSSGVVLADVKSFITANCAVSGCHAGSVSPDFRKDNVIIDKASRIRARTTAKSMPPPSSGFSLSANEIEAIDCWVADGAPN